MHYTTLRYTTLRYTTLRYPTLHYTTQHTALCCTALHYTALHHTTPHYSTPHYTTPHYTTPDYTTLNYTTLHYITLHSLHSLHHRKCNCNYTTLITLHHNYNSTTLQLQLHYTTLHPAVVGEVTTATIATIPETQLQPPFGQSVDSLCHPWFTTTNLSYRLPIFETSATALCGTTGIDKWKQHVS